MKYNLKLDKNQKNIWNSQPSDNDWGEVNTRGGGR